jgi:hypothetical protein
MAEGDCTNGVMKISRRSDTADVYTRRAARLQSAHSTARAAFSR